MWKVCGSSLINCKSKPLFPVLPLISLLGMAFCPQAHSGQANVAYFAGGCFWCTEAVFQEAPGVTSVVSGYMQGAETVQISFDPAKTSYDKLLNLFWRAHNPTKWIDRDRMLGSNIVRSSFTPMINNGQQPRNRRHRRKNHIQNRSQLRLLERDHFVRRQKIIRTSAGKTQTIRTSDK
jgi:Peptide methionine sulfoxide reductase